MSFIKRQGHWRYGVELRCLQSLTQQSSLGMMSPEIELDKSLKQMNGPLIEIFHRELAHHMIHWHGFQRFKQSSHLIFLDLQGAESNMTPLFTYGPEVSYE